MQLPTFECPQRLAGGLRLPARMTLLLLGPRRLTLVSPIPIDDALAATLAAHGEVELLIAPNALHHLYLEAAMQRYPHASVLVPPALVAKRPGLRHDGTLDGALPASLRASTDVVRIEGAPRIDEFALYHRDTRTLVVTDLVFHVLRPQGWLTHLVLLAVGCHGRLAQSRAYRGLIRDRAAAARSVEQLLALPFETLIMAHGEIVRDDARARLAEALRGLLPSRQALPLPR